MNAEEKITKAKTFMFIRQPFFAIIGLSLPFVEAPWCKTMATDGLHFFWNRDFVDKMTVNECMGVIAHEILHVAWMHPSRIGTRIHKIWNIACDISINQTLIDAKFQLPAGGVYGPQYDKYKDMTAYAIYEDLLKNHTTFINICFDKNGKGEDGDEDGDPTWGGVLAPMHDDGTPLTKEEVAAVEEEIKIKVAEAAHQAKSRGNLPAGLEGLVKAVGKPKVNWRDYIQNWVSGHTPDNYTWSRPNRKMFANYKIYMPRMQLNGAGVGVLSIDTSGSVSDQELIEYVREITGVIELCSPDKLYIIQHDAIVQKVDEWEAGMDFSELKIKGRGGTCIKPVFDLVPTLEDNIDWMICFTDMGIGDYPAAPGPDFPVLWCATGPDNAPFGIYLPLRDAMEE